MPIHFTIKITKEILQQSKECGKKNDDDGMENIGKNCAIACAVKHIFSEVFVTDYYIYPFGMDYGNRFEDLKIPLPEVAHNFIKVFDSLSAIPHVRMLLPEFEFDISIPDEIIAEINIDEVRDYFLPEVFFVK